MNASENLNDAENAPNPKLPPQNSLWREIWNFAFIAIVIVLPIRLFIAQPFIVSGASMDPTFADGQYIIVDEISYRFEKPSRGDVIIFKYPVDPKKSFIKRIIGLPGETVLIKDGNVSVINPEHPDSLALNEPYVRFQLSATLERTLGPSEYFVMGDNRAASLDSRVWGPLDAKLIEGRPLIRLLPIGQIGIFPGRTEF